MTKQKKHYEGFVNKITDAIQKSPDALKHWVHMAEEYGDAATDMTKDEWSLIMAYVKEDLKEFGQNADKEESSFKNSEFYGLVSETIWQRLAEVTDKSQVEWHEVMQDLEHQGVYEAGDMIALGTLVCDKCGHRLTYTHVQRIESCSVCGGTHFIRHPLAP